MIFYGVHYRPTCRPFRHLILSLSMFLVYVQYYVSSLNIPPLKFYDALPYSLYIYYHLIRVFTSIFHVLYFYIHEYFHMDAGFAQSHPTTKCDVLCVTGLLCFINPNVQPDRWNAHRNVVKRSDLKKLFRMLFERFHVGLWSTMLS